jgi:histidine triad (HIT) family protein
MVCPFCEVDVRVTRVIEENKLSYVSFSNPRLVRGHLLVIPRRHVEKLSELVPEEKQELLNTAIRYQELILAKAIGTGCDIRQNYRPFMQQNNLKVNHLHFHLLPRTLKDELYHQSMKYEIGLFQELSEKEYTDISKRLGF